MLRYVLLTMLILTAALMPKTHISAQDDEGWGDGCDEKAIVLIADTITAVDYARGCDDFRLCLYSTNGNLSCRIDATRVFMETCTTVKCERYALLLGATLSFFGDSTVDGPDDQPPQIVIDLVPEILNAYQQDDYTSALSKLQVIAEENGLGFDAMLHLSQGIVHEQLDAPGNALAAYDRALQTAPSDALILYARTKLLGALGRREETAFEARRLSQYFQLSPGLQTLIIPLQEQYTLHPGQSESWLLYPIISAGFGPGGDHFFAIDHLPPVPVGLTPYPPTDGLLVSGMHLNSPENELELEMMFFSREGQEYVFYWPKGFDAGGTIRLYAVSSDHDVFFVQSSRLFYEAYSIEHFLLVREGTPDPRIDLIGTRCGVISRLRPNVEIAAHSFDPDGEPIFDMPGGQKIGAATSFTVLNDHKCVDTTTW